MTDTPDPQPITATVLSSSAGADKLVLHLQLDDELAKVVQRGTVLSFSVQPPPPPCSCIWPVPDHDDACPRYKLAELQYVDMPGPDLPYLTPVQLASIMHSAQGTIGAVQYLPDSCGTCSRADMLHRRLVSEAWAKEHRTPQAMLAARGRSVLATGTGADLPNEADLRMSLAMDGPRLGLARADGKPWPQGMLVRNDECTADDMVWLTGGWASTLGLLRQLHRDGMPKPHADELPVAMPQVVSWQTMAGSNTYAWHVLDPDQLEANTRSEAQHLLLEAAAFEAGVRS